MTRLAPALRHNALDFNIPQRHRLRWQQLVGDHNERALQGRRVRIEHVGQVGTQPDHDIADVGQSLIQVLVLGRAKRDACIRPAAAVGPLEP